jgi:hypothetical protein
MKLLLKGFAPLVFSYPVTKQLESLAYQVSADEIQQIEGRQDCYPVSDRIVSELSDHFGVPVKAELFRSSSKLPHADRKGPAAVIPLQRDCFLQIDGVRFELNYGGLYAFDDALPHNSGGVMIMVTFPEEAVLP